MQYMYAHARKLKPPFTKNLDPPLGGGGYIPGLGNLRREGGPQALRPRFWASSTWLLCSSIHSERKTYSYTIFKHSKKCATITINITVYM